MNHVGDMDGIEIVEIEDGDSVGSNAQNDQIEDEEITQTVELINKTMSGDKKTRSGRRYGLNTISDENSDENVKSDEEGAMCHDRLGNKDQ